MFDTGEDEDEWQIWKGVSFEKNADFFVRKSLFLFYDGNAGTLVQIIVQNERRTLAHFQNITRRTEK